VAEELPENLRRPFAERAAQLQRVCAFEPCAAGPFGLAHAEERRQRRAATGQERLRAGEQGMRAQHAAAK
jgi:hypothetical protein